MSEPGGTKNDQNVRHSARTRTFSEKGIIYEGEKLKNSSKVIARKIYKLCEKIDKLASSDEDQEQITDAVLSLDEAHSAFEKVVSKAESLKCPITNDDVQDIMMAVTTAKLRAMKVNTKDKVRRPANGDQVINTTAASNISDILKSNNTVPEAHHEAEKARIVVSSDKKKDDEAISSDSILPEKWLLSLDSKLQKQLNMLCDVLGSNNDSLIKSELANLEHLMDDISVEKTQLSTTFAHEENKLLTSWFEQACLDVANKKEVILKQLAKVSTSTELSACQDFRSNDQSYLSSKTTTSPSLVSVIEKISTVRKSANEAPTNTKTSICSTKSKSRSNIVSKRSEISEGHVTSHKKKEDVQRWLSNHSDQNSIRSGRIHSSHSSVQKRSDRGSIVYSDIGSESQKFLKDTKHSIDRIHKRLLMQLNLIDSALATDDAELVKTETSNLDRILSELSEASVSYQVLITDEEKAAHDNWMDNTDTKVFEKKQEVCSWLVNHNECISRKSSRSSSKSSSKSSSNSKNTRTSRSSSNSSSKSAIQQKAITAGLQAEADLLKETMNKAIETEAKRKEDEIQGRIGKLQVQIAKSKAMEEVYCGSIQSKQQKATNEAQRSSIHKINSKDTHHESESTSINNQNRVKSTVELKPNADTPNTNGSKQVTELSKDMVRALKAPPAEIDVFSGDPLEYEYFRSNFREAVEKLIDDQRGRLTRLIKYTDGDAKDLIKHCVHGDPTHCYDQAILLLDAEYGSSHRISYAYLQRLQEWPPLKVTDTASFKKLYRFLLQCRTYKTQGRLQELDSATTLKTVIQKLHVSYQDEWSMSAEKCRRNGKEASFDDLVSFVDFHSSRAADPAYSRGAMTGEKEKVKGFVGKVSPPEVDPNTAKCPLCRKEHILEKCKVYLEKDVKERNKAVFELKLCFKCLNPTSEQHHARVCKQKMVCDTCGKCHPTTLHDRSKEKKDKPHGENENSKIAACSVQHRDAVNVISLCILPVLVSHKDNPQHECLVYAMLDNDCTGCFCTTEIMERIAPNQQREACITVETINGTSEKQTSAINNLVVRRPPCSDDISPTSVFMPTTFGFDGLTVTQDEIPTPTNLKQWNHLNKLHDLIPEYNDNIPFGLMIGGNCPKALEPLEVIPSHDNGPYAFKTRLGWCVVGPLSSSNSDEKDASVQCHRTRIIEMNSSWSATDMITGAPANHRFVEASEAKDTYISKRLKEMYTLEFNEINGEAEAYSKEDEKFLEIMNSSVQKVDGHYQLPLPFKSAAVNLPCNRRQAEKRLNSVRRKMDNSDIYRKEYVSNISTLIKQGFARKCDSQSNPTPGSIWYLPHHGVYQEVKKKLRIVFDCSASYRGYSLNNELLQGPDLTNQLVGVLLRFRMHYVPIMADIEAMFHQVRIPEEHRSFLRFLWWEDGDIAKEVTEYEMCVHIFGAISSPSCANFALKKTAEDNREQFGNEAADTILRNFYVDDMIKSTDEEEGAVSLLSGVQNSCKEGGFNLTKVVSNSHKVINSTPIDKRAASLKEFESCTKLPVERALGVVWSVENDSFGFRINIQDQPLTRRGILSSISSIYDPCGLGSPFLLKGRKILQEITADMNGWDDPVSQAHVSSWEKWRSELPQLESISVKRCVKPDDFGIVTESSLHCFSDASFFGYGQATYLRQVNNNGQISVSLVMAKSRVSPLKSTTVPRLELTAAVLSSNVGSLVKSELALQGMRDIYWVDNMVVLGYIHNDSRRFRIFVANRTRKIREHTDKEQWRYVSTDDNPGDDASRGLSFDDEKKIARWFNGPDFLHQPESSWLNKTEIDRISDIDPELKVKVTVNTTITADDPCLLSTIELHISDWFHQKRAVANIRRFAKKCLKQTVPSVMTTAELQEAETILLRLMQKKYLEEDLKSIKKGISTKSSALNKLNPFFDESGILRVGGRLSNSDAEENRKHPIILGKKGSHRIIEWHHRNVQHQGRTSTVNELRANGYWFLSVNAQVRHMIRSCMRCRLLRGALADQMMADLPVDRLLTEPPFTYCGVDIFGPFHIKEGRKQMKRYGVLFTCLSLRAVHIETAANIDTDSFVLSLRRFIARRGPVRVIRSDNGGNFVGCENEFVQEIEKMDNKKIGTFLLSENCDWIIWKKNPPVSSHMGGAWERMIRSIRNVLDALLKEHPSRLDDESLNTLMVEAENIVNSRPLTMENLTDPESAPLTANQLLTLKTKVVMPPPGVFQKEHVYCRKRWKTVQYLANQFWERWRKEYMIILQSRQKWLGKKRNFEVGDIVMVKEEKIPRNRWKLGRITETFPSKDGLVRSANVCLTPCKTSLKRPITKLVLLVGAEEQK